jgi:glutathione S-transferase
MIFHITFESDWDKAKEQGEYRLSTKGRTLEEQGFIHGGTATQVAPVANLIYGSDEGLVVLVIDEERLSSPLQYDVVPGWDEPLPHIYGPLNLAAVVSTLPLTRGADGKYEFTPPNG